MIDKGGFDELKKVIERKLRFFPERYKIRPFKRRIAVRMRYNKMNSYRTYAHFLDQNEWEQRVLHKTLTINVSKFFRNVNTFQKIEDEVFSRIIDFCEKEKRMITVWCAGCATGEECYTIAMIIDRYVKAKGSNIPFSVIGTDIDVDSVESARMACYGRELFDETPEGYVKDYFIKDSNYCVIEELKKKVQFIYLDIEEECEKLNNLDLVLFRNVLIYLERGFQERILSLIHERLNERGFLVLGKVETLTGLSRNLFTVVDTRERIYRKCQILKESK
jgi:chemotaxis protein methyltransferase CheR